MELFQILKDDAVKCCTQYASKFGKKQWSEDWKRSVFRPIPMKGNAKEYSNSHTIALIPHTSKFIKMAYLFIEISRSVLITIYFDVIAFIK